MKKFTLFIGIVCFWSSGLLAQYQSLFGNLQASWNVLNESSSTYITDSLVIDSDTTINVKTYKKVLFYHLRHAQNLPPVHEATIFIREETTTGRAWVLYDNSGTEQLFMDLSLNINGLFSVNTLNYPVDSVYTKDGRKHVRVQYSYPVIVDYPVNTGYLTFIEGVGTTFGFTYDFNNSGIGGYPANHIFPFLLCSWKDNNHIYTQGNPNPFFDNCYKQDTIVGIENYHHVEKGMISFGPNPASNIIVVESIGNHKMEKITLCNFLGQTMSILSVFPSNKNILDVSNFHAGIYFIHVRFSDNLEVTKKLIIQH